LHTMEVDAGIMITASHNPAEYNGMKLCLGTRPVAGAELQAIRAIYRNKQFATTGLTGSAQVYDSITAYLDFLTKHFSYLRGMTRTTVIDCGNGATGAVLPRLVEMMDWKNVRLMYAEVDGTYPHHVADPTVERYMEDLKNTVIATQADLGIGFDGDGDRMAPLTFDGKLIPGDQLLALFSTAVVEQQPGAPIVFDVAASSSLQEYLTAIGATPIVSPTGHTNIKRVMREYNAPLAGEISCHFMFKDRYFGYDDGIYAALRLLELLQQSGKTLQELLSVLPHKTASPAYRIPCAHESRMSILAALKETFEQRNDTELILIDGIRVQFPYGWAIVRASNTEPVLCIRCEGNSEEALEHIKHDLASVLKEHHIACQCLHTK
jgi:phosphomannomutase / phosphoglucomutase